MSAVFLCRDRLAALVAAHLWDEQSSAFVNVFSTNGAEMSFWSSFTSIPKLDDFPRQARDEQRES